MSNIKEEYHDAIENGIRGQYVRVIYSYNKQQVYLDEGYTETKKQAEDVTNEFLRTLYNDPSISSYAFIKGIQKKNHNFRLSDVLYFYSLKK